MCIACRPVNGSQAFKYNINPASIEGVAELASLARILFVTLFHSLFSKNNILLK